MRIIDLSITLTNDVVTDPPYARPKIEYFNHHDTAPRISEFFGIGKTDLPEGEYAALERVTLSTHNGTHLDAPYHFFSRMDEALVEGGRPAMRIDEVPLEWCFQPGVKLDFRHFPDGYVATAADVQAELARIEHTLSPLEIVVVNTRAGERLGHDDYLDAGCGMGESATRWLLDQGVRVTGTDGWSWDAPFSHTQQKVKETGDTDLIWEGHRVGRQIGYCHLEKLGNLQALPAKGFRIACFPCKIENASAGWTRAVAILED